MNLIRTWLKKLNGEYDICFKNVLNSFKTKDNKAF